MRKRIVAMLLAVSLAASMGSESIYAAGEVENEAAEEVGNEVSEEVLEEASMEEAAEEVVNETVEESMKEEVEEAAKEAVVHKKLEQEQIIGEETRENKEAAVEKADEMVYGAGNSIASAANISLSGTANGVISAANKGDYYKVTVPNTSSVQLNLKFTSYMESVYFKVYNGNGTELIDKTVYWNPNISQVTEDYELYLNPGTYYIAVLSYGDLVNDYYGRYSCSLSYTALNNMDLSMDDTIANAHAIPLSTSFTGVLAEDEKSDIYRINVTSPGIIQCNLSAYMERVYLKLLDAEGKELLDHSPYWNENIGYSTDSYEFALEKGTYYIQVYAYGDYRGKYTISNKYTDIGSKEREKNDTLQTANTMVQDQWVSGLMAHGEDSDVYKFTVSKNKVVSLGLKAYMKWIYLRIYNYAGTEIYSQNPSWNENIGYSNNTYQYTLPKGTYYIQLRADGSYRGKYQLKVSQLNLISGAKISSIKNKVYTGKGIKPSVTVKYNGKTLKKGTDYTVSYQNNKYIGKATVIITGKGKYTGTKTASFKIIPRKATLTKAKNSGTRKVTLWWKKDKSVDGFEIYRSVKKSSSYKKVGTVSSYYTGCVIYNMKKGKTYYFKIRAYKYIDGKKCYGSCSNVKSVKIKK